MDTADRPFLFYRSESLYMPAEMHKHSLLEFFETKHVCVCTMRLRKDIQSVGEELGYVRCLAKMFGFFGMQPFVKFDQSKRTSMILAALVLA